VSSVPTIAGHAPNSPAIGSQVDDVMNPAPNRSAASPAPCVSSKTSASRRAGIVAAATIRIHLKIVSPREVLPSDSGTVLREAPLPRP
jgi:hypothetical protein